MSLQEKAVTGSVAQVLLAAAGAIGVDLSVGTGDRLRTSSAAAALLELPALERVCVVIVDGLGLRNLQQRADAAPTLTGAARIQALRSEFPSTTATNMAALGTGQSAGQTGMLGYSVRNPARRTLLNLISWTDGPDPQVWQSQPTIFELLAAQGVLSVSVGPWAFEGSPLTQATMRGAEYESAQSLPDRVRSTVEVLGEPDAKVVTMYWGEVDRVGHEFGWRSPQWRSALSELDRELGILREQVPPGTLVLVTADHGMVDIPLGASRVFDGPARFDIAQQPSLAQGVELVAGEPRCVHLYTEAGAAVQVETQWRRSLGDRAQILRREEAISAGWFGPVADQHRPVIGDVVAAMRGDISVHDSRTQSEASMRLVGMHGSHSEYETTVPLVLLADG
ncbi:MAG: alkaline phosphatase family protein [Beutenbergiaceae bacterium]